MAAEGPEGAIGSFTDPATKQAIFIVPKEGESATDATKRVRSHHGLNPDLGEYQKLHDTYVLLADSLKAGDLAEARKCLNALSEGIMLTGSQLERDKRPSAIEPSDAQLDLQRRSADAATAYRRMAFTAPLPTTPEIPSVPSYEKLFSRD
jgi:hypothetical protein